MSDQILKNLEAAIAEQLRQQHFYGVIHISQNGDPLFSHAYGLANRSELLPNRLNTRFGIASGGKIFTATAIAQLVDQGTLSFDQSIHDFLDGALPNINSKVTLRHLLSHISGIPDYFDESIDDVYETVWHSKPVYHMRSAVDFYPFIEDLPMQFVPGEKFSYNNMGFILLGKVIEKASGMCFQDYIEEKVFGSAWMRSSGYFFNDQLPANCALGYIEDSNGDWHNNLFSIPIVGHADGGVYTTAADMGRFWKAFFEGRFFSQPIMEEILKPHSKPGREENIFYGLGIWIYDSAVVRYYYLTGEDPGVDFYSACYPDQNIQFTVLGNSNGPTWPLSKVIRNQIFS